MIVYSNQFLEDMFGYARGELLGQAVEILIPGELRGHHIEHRHEYSKAPETRLMGAGRDLRGLRKDKSTFPVEVGLSPVTTSAGLQVVAIVTDITKRKYAEQQSLLQKDIALILSQADSIQNVARKLLQTIGPPLGWSVGTFWLAHAEAGVLRNIAVWHQPRSHVLDLEAITRQRVLRMGEGFVGEVWASGKPLWVSDLRNSGDFVRDKDAVAAGLRSVFEMPIQVGQQVLGVLEFFAVGVRSPDEAIIEIAAAVSGQIGQFMERLRTEKALGISQERYRSLFANAVFGIIRTTAAGDIMDANPALVSMLGYDTVDEVFLLNCHRHIYKNTGIRDPLSVGTGDSDRFEGLEAEWKTKRGETLHVRLSGRNLRNDDGEVAGFEAIVENITQRKLLEEQFQRAQKLEAIGRLAGGVAHDFNNLLTIIAVSTDTIMEGLAVTDSLRRTVEEIDRATEHGASLVRQLMAFSRRQPHTLEVVSLRDVLQSSERMFRILAGESIQIDWELDPTECFVGVEQSKLEQILMNLVANSRDAMPNGGRITISTSLVDVDEEMASEYVGIKARQHVKLAITDTGYGIPPEVLSHIFEPFFTTKEKGKGTGLGLSTVYGIVNEQEGYIGCESVLNGGTTFTILLPAAQQKAAAPGKVSAPSGIRNGTEKILLVEDDPALRASVQRSLEKNGYKLIAAADGHEALRTLHDHEDKFDLMITDIALPQMRGTELAERVLRRCPEMKILFMSGYAGDSLPPEASHFLPKPFKLETLVRKIRDILER
jgi:PAS domain S-box-containing protein